MNKTVFKSIVVFEKEVAFKWGDESESFVDIVLLRKSCPCAWCSGEKDVFGNVYSAKKNPLPSHAFIIKSFELVGLYGLRFFWKDGHCDGIYTFNTIKLLSNESQ